MGWLLILAVILGVVFPPLGAVILAVMVWGVFAKGMAEDSPEEIARPKPRRRLRRRQPRPEDETPCPVIVPPGCDVIDVRSYPPLPPLPTPTPQRK